MINTVAADGPAPVRPGHTQAQWRSNKYAWNMIYNASLSICGFWNLDKQYSVRWSDLSLWEAWHLRGQDIHRHSENQIHMHGTRTIVFIRVHMECWDLLKTISSWWSAPDLWMAWHVRGQDIHRRSEDQINMGSWIFFMISTLILKPF